MDYKSTCLVSEQSFTLCNDTILKRYSGWMGDHNTINIPVDLCLIINTDSFSEIATKLSIRLKCHLTSVIINV